jgi:hypothetical protein
MSKRNWEKRLRRQERQEDWRFAKLGAQTPKRAAYNTALQARLKREAAQRRSQGSDAAS